MSEMWLFQRICQIQTKPHLSLCICIHISSISFVARHVHVLEPGFTILIAFECSIAAIAASTTIANATAAIGSG
jgi:hypothetical protein